jgi:hypothetical protein
VGLNVLTSYVVVANISCDDKITALFDLIVLGNIEALEIEVKGKFICTGKCFANAIIVHDDIWAKDIEATSIETNGRVTAQELKAETIIADGNIMIAQTLDVGSTAESNTAIICGETVFGAGMIRAPKILTGEPLDLDDGEDAVISQEATSQPNAETDILSIDITPVSDPEYEETQSVESDFKSQNDYCGYLDAIISTTLNEEEREKLREWKSILTKTESNDNLNDCLEVSQLIWLSEIAGSDYFKNWSKIDELFISYDEHFLKLIHDSSDKVVCVIGNYHELLKSLRILYLYGDIMSEEIHDWLFEQIVSNLGLKSKFVTERLNEKGWNIHA